MWFKTLMIMRLRSNQTDVLKILNEYENINRYIISHLGNIVELEDTKQR